MKINVILISVSLISIISITTFADIQLINEEVRCVEGGTVNELQIKMNRAIQELSPWTSSISAPSLLLKHSGLANPYVMCVTAKYTLGY